MDLYEKDALKSWGFSYAPNQVTEWQYHYSTMFRQWMDQAFRYMPQDLGRTPEYAIYGGSPEPGYG